MPPEAQSGTNPLIAYMAFRAFDHNEAYRGAILITDESTKPVEFRCTAPVRPTPLQRMLYGDSLLPHILTELVGLPLLASIRERPKLLLIPDMAFFEIRTKTSLPVIHLSRAAVPTDASTIQPRAGTQLLESSSGRFPSLLIRTHPHHPADAQAARELLQKLFSAVDVMEPFARVMAGLEYVHDERVLER